MASESPEPHNRGERWSEVITLRVILRDGRVADVREATGSPAERSMLKDLFQGVSQTSLYYRFFHAVREVDDKTIAEMLASDLPDKYALLLISGDTIIGISHFMRTDQEGAEIDFVVDERFHGYGIGTLLLEEMADVAWRYGLRRFEAYVLQENQKMIQLFRNSGFEVQHHYDPGDYTAVRMVLPLAETERGRALRDTREQMATAASLRPFLHPQTVAVIGASRDPSHLGHVVFRHIVESGFSGTVYPVNPSARAVAGVRAYPRLDDLPEAVDLALLAVPAPQVRQIVDQCIEAHVGAVAILSAGFSDTGAASAQQELAHRLREAGIRLLGPNCFGLLTTSQASPLNASFAPTMPRRGNLAIASQSGALGVAILDYASRLGVGVSSFVSMGNKADVSGNDLLQYWESDPETSLIALYLESFGNPRKFTRICRRLTPVKPVLVVKSARTRGGAAVSEYGAEPRDRVFEGLFRQAGIVRADTLEELFDVAALLDGAILPQGGRIAVVTNSAGGAVITVDSLPKEGLELALPPIDLGFEALADGYRKALPALLRSPDVDAVIVLFIPVGMSQSDEVARKVAEAVEEVAQEQGGPAKPIVANFLLPMDGKAPLGWIDTSCQRIPVYPFPERAVRALGQAVRYARFRNQPRGRIPDLENCDTEAARDLLRGRVPAGAALEQPEVLADVLQHLGLAVGREGAESGTFCARISIAQDPLFGPIMAIEPASRNRAAPLERIVPLTDRDAQALARRCLHAIGQEDDQQVEEALSNLLLRLSRLADEAPEMAAMEILVHFTSPGFTATPQQLRLAPAGEPAPGD